VAVEVLGPNTWSSSSDCLRKDEQMNEYIDKDLDEWKFKQKGIMSVRWKEFAVNE